MTVKIFAVIQEEICCRTLLSSVVLESRSCGQKEKKLCIIRSSDGSSLMQRGARLSSGRQESKQRTNLFTCARDYSVVTLKTLSGLPVAESNKTMLANKDNSRGNLYGQLTLCEFVYNKLTEIRSIYVDGWNSNGGQKEGQPGHTGALVNVHTANTDKTRQDSFVLSVYCPRCEQAIRIRLGAVAPAL